jgi:hypothetical protein
MNSLQVLFQVIPPHEPIRSSFAASKSATMNWGVRVAPLVTMKLVDSGVRTRAAVEVARMLAVSIKPGSSVSEW